MTEAGASSHKIPIFGSPMNANGGINLKSTMGIQVMCNESSHTLMHLLKDYFGHRQPCDHSISFC